MKIRKDPVKAKKAQIAEILRNHEWLMHELHSSQAECHINFDLLADLVYDIYQGNTFGRGEIN